MDNISRHLSIKLDGDSFKILEDVQAELRDKMEQDGIKARVTKATAIAYLCKKHKEGHIKP
jgi:hypothetical protein